MMINYRERHEFLEIFPKKSVGAELGVFKGEFSKKIIEIVNPCSLHLIDTWWTTHGEYYPDWGEYTNYGELSTHAAYLETVKNIEEGNTFCKIHVGDDLLILESFPDNFFDWVYVDSSHNYEHTLKELLLLQYKVKRNGMITGHDWQPVAAHQHHGVYKAVIEFMEKTDWKITFRDNHTQWVLSNVGMFK